MALGAWCVLLFGGTLLLYLLGTVAALAIAAIFKKTLLRGPMRPMILELPPYRWPSLRSLAVSVTQRCELFLRRAGTVILALSIVLWLSVIVLTVVLVAICVAFLMLEGWREWTSREAAVHRAEQEMTNLARSLRQHADDTFQIVSVAFGLRNVADTVRAPVDVRMVSAAPSMAAPATNTEHTRQTNRATVRVRAVDSF